MSTIKLKSFVWATDYTGKRGAVYTERRSADGSLYMCRLPCGTLVPWPGDKLSAQWVDGSNRVYGWCEAMDQFIDDGGSVTPEMESLCESVNEPTIELDEEDE